MKRAGLAGTRAYAALMWLLFLPAVPLIPSLGGYTRITGVKYALFLCLTLPWLLTALPETCRRLARRGPKPVPLFLLGFLAWSLAAALLSPWPAVALLGGGRHEGYLTLLLYGLGGLCFSALWTPGRRPLLCPALGLGFLDLICLLQLLGKNPLGLYPPGMGWRDANILYPGSYLGTVGNAGTAAAVLCTASALLFLGLLRRGGVRYLLLLPLLPAGWILGRMGVDAGVLALAGLTLLAPAAAVRTFSQLGRWLLAAPLLLAALFPGLGFLLPLSPAGGLLLLLRREDAPLPPALRKLITGLTLAGAALAPLLILNASGGCPPLEEAGELLRGRVREDMGGGRIYIWRQVLENVGRSPLVGFGPDTLGLLELRPYAWYSPETGKQVLSAIDAAHCEYLQTLICQGLPAALCHLGLALAALARFLRRGDTPGGVCAGAALCYGIQALFGISSCAAAPLFWLLLGCSEAGDETAQPLANPGGLC